MDAFLFDLDGLLVESEPLHFEAFVRGCAERGFKIDWSFEHYCKKAHTQSLGLKKAFLEVFPEAESGWPTLYHEIKQAFSKLVLERPLPLVKGVDAMLHLLKERQKKMAVVTNSSALMVQSIIEKQPVLEMIPLWITREDYLNAKPEPDGYLKALEVLRMAPSQAIGFEDSPRGIKALKNASVLPVHIHEAGFGEAIHYQNFQMLLKDEPFLNRIL